MKVTAYIQVDGYPMAAEFDIEDISGDDPLGLIAANMRSCNYDPYKPVGALPVAASAPAAAAPRQAAPPQRAQSRYQDNDTRRGGPPFDGGGWQCPVHGDQNLGQSYFDQSVTECKVNTENPEQDDPAFDWIKTDQDGYAKADKMGRYWCRHSQPKPRSNNGGGGRGGYSRGGGGGYRR